MRNVLPTTLLIAAMSQSSATAHEALTHRHAEVVPIPPYSLPYGEAGGAAALTAAQSFLATFNSGELSTLVFS